MVSLAKLNVIIEETAAQLITRSLLTQHVTEAFQWSEMLPWLRPRPELPLINLSQKKMTSDQTKSDWNSLWTDYRALETPCAFESFLWSDYHAPKKQTFLFRIVCAWIYLWSDSSGPGPKMYQIRLKCSRNSLIREWF